MSLLVVDKIRSYPFKETAPVSRIFHLRTEIKPSLAFVHDILSAQQDGLILMSMCDLLCVHMLVTKTISIHFLLAYKDNTTISTPCCLMSY